MSYEELDRVSIVQQVIDGRLAQRAAGTMLGLTSRQVRRLCRAYETHGPAGLASKRRGRPSNRRLAEALRREALELVRARYEVTDQRRRVALAGSMCLVSFSASGA